MSVVGRVPLALVQHANQHLITDGYADREGLSELLDAYEAVLRAHLANGVPLHLHLSGILVEAIAWHRPAFFERVKELGRAGLLELIGSAYAQNVMTLFSFEHNIRQLNESFRAYQRHLGVAAGDVRGCWIPERVWDTQKLAPVLRSARLANGGFSYVLIDDRLAYPRGGDESDRARFDGSNAPALSYAGPLGPRVAPWGDGREHRPYLIEGGEGLVAVSLSSELRYCVPPRTEERWAALRRVADAVEAAGTGAVATYGDDLEKTAAAGSWSASQWRPGDERPYADLLRWAARDGRVEPVLLSGWLRAQGPLGTRRVDAGTFYELAHQMGAGEDYRTWWDDPAYAAYRDRLLEAEALLLAAPPHEDGLWALAWKQLMACSYETAWHDRGDDGTLRPAPWAKALASHVGAVFVIAAAGRWLEQRDGEAHVELCDVDRDGHLEVVLKNDHVYAVVTPAYGGRLVYFFDLADAGRLVVGNPADDWNWQEELNRYMEIPRAHPGAFAEVGHENDPFTVELLAHSGNEAAAIVRNAQELCALRGMWKRYGLARTDRSIEVSYRLPVDAGPLDIEFCLSFDHLRLLREGRGVVAPLREDGHARGWRSGDAVAWVALPSDGSVVWSERSAPQPGHGLLLEAVAHRDSFAIRIGVGGIAPREVSASTAAPGAGVGVAGSVAAPIRVVAASTR